MAGAAVAVSKRVSTRTGKTSYQVVIDRRDGMGRRNRVTVGTYRTRKEAEKAERKALDEVDTRQYVERDNMTVAELLALWLAAKDGTVRGTTYHGYTAAVRLHLVPVLGNMRVQDVQPMDVQRMLSGWRRAEMGGSLMRTCYRVLSAAFAFAVTMRLVQVNPCTGIQAPVKPHYDPVVWSEDEVVRFLGVAGDDPYAVLWYLLIETGMRRGEVLGLRWRDVDWQERAVRVCQIVIADPTQKGAAVIQPMPKTDAGYRSIVISDELIAMLRERRRDHMDDELVMATRNGTPLPPRSVGTRLDALAALAGVRRCRVHDLRHLAATRMARAGVPMVVAQMRMGHASSDITRRVYQHADMSMQRAAVDALAALAGRRAAPLDGEHGDGDTEVDMNA